MISQRHTSSKLGAGRTPRSASLQQGRGGRRTAGPKHPSSAGRATVAGWKELWEVKSKATGPVWQRPRTREDVRKDDVGPASQMVQVWEYVRRSKGAKNRCKGTRCPAVRVQ